MHRLFRCLIRKNGEGKGEWPKDSAKRGRLALAASARRSHVPAGGRVSSGALGAFNLLSDPRGVRFGTGHYMVCLQY